MIDPATNKGKVRLRQLSDLLAQVDSLETYPLWRVERTRDAMERGEPVTYAAWARSCEAIEEELDRRKCKEPRSTRIGRRTTA